MSDFFTKTDLSRKDAENIISETLNNCDDGELYLENSKSESIVLDDDKIKSSSYSSDLGYGLRAVTGEVVAYSHSNEISRNSLKQSANNLSSTLKSQKGQELLKYTFTNYLFSFQALIPPVIFFTFFIPISCIVFVARVLWPPRPQKTIYSLSGLFLKFSFSKGLPSAK